jgi:hypothetical protein
VIEWDNAPPPDSGDPILRIAQSGRFFVVTFGQRPPMSMKLQEGWTGKTKGRKLSMRLARPPWELRLDGDIPHRQRWQVPEMNLELVGPTRHVGIARRVFPQTAENAAEPEPAPQPLPEGGGPPEPAEISANLPTTTMTTTTTGPTPTASVPSEPDHAR